MDLITLNTNKTTTFLLPMLFPDSTHDEIFSNYFKRAYVGLLDEPDDLDYNVVLEFDEDNCTQDSLEDFIQNIETPAEVKNVGDNTITYVFNDEWHKFQYETFLRGAYSKFAESVKQNILEFWKETEEDSLLRGILYNLPVVVESYTPYLDKEILDEMKDTIGESWPPPNLFVDEFLVV